MILHWIFDRSSIFLKIKFLFFAISLQFDTFLNSYFNIHPLLAPIYLSIYRSTFPFNGYVIEIEIEY